ncbi:uncharacterized protein EDB91DRAFT_1086855 [Suillus paluster]|uniref:uncharacterized protein n=1 Tax=Suillus paluster TaxID=48578 RepID=UPI001B8817FF|nr:uncharacterized protein EDB91DRAFT_1086855 [Suillus paluster]KAG1726180.1 hypothetical protein EDB91DRAFT_1086855 [Suillus paluster]
MPGHRHAQPATAMPAAVPIPTIPIPAVPIPAAVGSIANALMKPRRNRQLPHRYWDNASIHADPSRAQPMADEGEIFNLDDISDDDEEEEDHPPAPRVMAPTVPSPLQTVINSPYPTQTDLLATGGLTRKAKDCIQLLGVMFAYFVNDYMNLTQHTSHHTILYLEEAGCHGWPIQIKPLNALLEQGWTVTTIHERLRDLSCTMDSLGDVPNHDDVLLGTRQSGSLKDEIPNFTVDEMHQQLVRFVVADDQAINVVECPEFRRLIRLL